ncbi:MAG: xylanase deacetylase [Blastococcus sp.]|nr:xylanase deacetylase [Blastococcus sp.]
MSLSLPGGAKMAVAIGSDFDAHSAWMGAFGRTSPSYLSRGEFGAEVGVPRLLELFRRFDIKTTFFTPGHSMVTFPERMEQILADGHEVASHGCYHESIPTLSPERERELMEIQLQQYAKIVGGRPRGYRSPAWDFSEITMSLLEEYGFEWDSSLMGREYEPYHPRPVELHYESANIFGPPTPILEFPVSWYLDDFPAQEPVAGINAGLGDHDLLFRRWRDIFDYAYENCPGAVYALTIHPQCSGRSIHMKVLEKLITHMQSFEGVYFGGMSSIYDCWTDDEDTTAG